VAFDNHIFLPPSTKQGEISSNVVFDML
jgi:hypothetical protein